MSLRKPFSLPLALLLAGLSAAPARPDLPAFERLKELAGDWTGGGAGGEKAQLSYDVVSSGSALREFLSLGDQPAMVSIYHPVGDRIQMTHYCLNRTQSRMRTGPLGPVPARFEFDYVDATNVLQATDGVMRAVTLVPEGRSRLTQIWNSANTTDRAAEFHFRRVGRKGPRPVHRSVPVPAAAPAVLRKMAELEGDWVGRWVPEARDARTLAANYRVVSGGNAVMETLEIGDRTPMVTMYYPVDGRLMATHYCASKTQPRLRATALAPVDGRLELAYVDATNVLAGTTSFMRHLDLAFTDRDHFTETWNQDSPQAGGAFSFAFTRKAAGP